MRFTWMHLVYSGEYLIQLLLEIISSQLNKVITATEFPLKLNEETPLKIKIKLRPLLKIKNKFTVNYTFYHKFNY